MADKVDIAALKLLLERATPRPWVQSALAPLYIVKGDTADVVCSLGEYKEDGTLDGIFENANANMPFIVAAVNALPALLAEREQLGKGQIQLASELCEAQRQTKLLRAEWEEIAALVPKLKALAWDTASELCTNPDVDEVADELSALLSRIQPAKSGNMGDLKEFLATPSGQVMLSSLKTIGVEFECDEAGPGWFNRRADELSRIRQSQQDQQSEPGAPTSDKTVKLAQEAFGTPWPAAAKEEKS